MPQPTILTISENSFLDGRKLCAKKEYVLFLDAGMTRTIKTVEIVKTGRKTEHFQDERKLDRETGEYYPFAIKRRSIGKKEAESIIAEWEALPIMQTLPASHGTMRHETRYLKP